MSTKTKYRRRRTYVSRAIQGRILWKFAFCYVAYNCFLLSVLVLQQILTNATPMSFAELIQLIWNTHFITFIVVAAAIPVFLWDILKTTHRIAGPLVRFENSLLKMQRGEPIETIRLRDHDMLNEFCDVFNAFIEYRNGELRDQQHENQSPRQLQQDDELVKAEQ